jgi:hypothetical protein
MSPRGTPTLGSGKSFEPNPEAEVLGTIPSDARITDPTPQSASNAWASDSGVTVEFVEPPPPWEVDGGDSTMSDARRFVNVPDNWVLRWINPRLLDQFGWRYWQPVMKSDPRVEVKVPTMVSPDGNIRRGGHTGDILGWMYRSWVEARRREQQDDTLKLTQSAVRRQETLKEEFASGKYGRVTLEDARHPRFTQADGREMRQRGD